MSKMSNQAVRDAEARSLDNAEEVARLRFANAEMRGLIEGLERWFREGIQIGPEGETWKAIRDLLARHADH